VLAGVAVGLFGVAPKLAVGGGWAALALVAVLMWIGPALRLIHWVMDVSPFTHVPRLPGGPMAVAPLFWLTAAAAALTAAGLAAFRGRDIG
jgi:ABC-2 type transport system permease protein